MYKIDYKNIKKGKRIGYIFFVAGLLFFVLISWTNFGGYIKKMSMDTKVKATNVQDNCHWSTDSDGDRSYICSPVYTYVVDEKEYQCVVGYGSSKKITESNEYVFYDSKNPKSCVTDYEATPSLSFILFNLFPLIFVIVGIVNALKINKRVKKLRQLANNGTLIKNLQYTMEPTGVVINNRRIMAPAIDYTLPSGSTIHLVGDGRHDGKSNDSDGYVDLLIDLNDTSNYYIDFNISSVNETSSIF